MIEHYTLEEVLIILRNMPTGQARSVVKAIAFPFIYGSSTVNDGIRLSSNLRRYLK